jgi:glycine/D-amino acid oxidase-like deaminating enzyme
MAKRLAAAGPGVEWLEPDVLIVGGGVQGLWLLNDLRREGYSALLLERRELGGEQTCHSHVYLHQGHLYAEVELAEHLKDVRALWEKWLTTHTVERGVTPSYFGFQNRWQAQQKMNLWSDPRLALRFRGPDAVAPPPALAGGAVRAVLESPEVCLDGQGLVRQLVAGVAEHVSRIEEVLAIRVNGPANAVEQVDVTLPGGRPLTFRPRALVLAAGAGNQALLQLASGGDRRLWERLYAAQQLRKAHMLVVRGPRDHLQPLTGVFHPWGLFIVGRDLDGEAVWLISDHRSEALSSAEDWLVYDEGWWLPQVLAALRALAPGAFGSPGRLRWGVYAAPKAEGRATGAIPHEERIEQFRLTNLWAVWPTKLTLAPLVSQAVAGQLRRLILAAAREEAPAPLWRSCRAEAPVAPERWRKLPLLSWDEFRRWYHLSEEGDRHEPQ